MSLMNYKGSIKYDQIQVDKSDTFERKGRDIFSSISIDLFTAIAGGEVQVPTIHGDVIMKIPPGSQPGDLKKLANKGIPDSSRGNGAHIVKINIIIPK